MRLPVKWPAALASKQYDCVVVGAGLRIVPKMTRIFEAVMNAVQEHAPRAKLAFNINPEGPSLPTISLREFRGARAFKKSAETDAVGPGRSARYVTRRAATVSAPWNRHR